MDLNNLLGTVARVLNDRTGPAQDVDTGGLLNEVAGIFRQQAGQDGQEIDTTPYENHGPGGILPASMDPDGDPADQGQTGYAQEGNILPASMDPLGDPADRMDGQGILPASQDPDGDPADQQSFNSRF